MQTRSIGNLAHALSNASFDVTFINIHTSSFIHQSLYLPTLIFHPFTVILRPKLNYFYFGWSLSQQHVQYRIVNKDWPTKHRADSTASHITNYHLSIVHIIIGRRRHGTGGVYSTHCANLIYSREWSELFYVMCSLCASSALTRADNELWTRSAEVHWALVFSARYWGGCKTSLCLLLLVSCKDINVRRASD